MKKLNLILSKILEVPAEEINDLSSPENVPSWDSFNGLMLVSELETAFNVKFSMQEVIAVKCVKDIKEALKRQGVELKE